MRVYSFLKAVEIAQDTESTVWFVLLAMLREDTWPSFRVGVEGFGGILQSGLIGQRLLP